MGGSVDISLVEPAVTPHGIDPAPFERRGDVGEEPAPLEIGTGVAQHRDAAQPVVLGQKLPQSWIVAGSHGLKASVSIQVRNGRYAGSPFWSDDMVEKHVGVCRPW